MSFLQTWGLKIGLVLALMAGSAGAAWFAADAHYGAKLAALRAADKQAAEDQAKQDAETLTRYAQASKEINDDAQAKIAGMSADIADLRVRNADGQSALGLCTSDPVRQSMPVADGRGTPAGEGPPPVATGPVEPPRIAIDAGEYRSELNVGIKAIEAELALRQILRTGGQTTPEK
jgi:hypothetical protein